MPPPERRIVLDTTSLLKVLGVLAVLGFLYIVRDILGLVFAALFLATLIRPAAVYFSERKVPKGVTVVVIYILLIGFALLSIGSILPVLRQQGLHLLNTAGQSWGAFSDGVAAVREFTTQYGLSDNFQAGIESLQAQLTDLTKGLFTTVTDVLTGLIALAAVLVMAFYMVVQEKDARQAFHAFVPTEYQELIGHILHRLQEQMGRWLLGQLALCVVIGVMYFVGLSVLGFESSLVLALFAAFTESIPYLGPILGAIPVLIVGASISPLIGILSLFLVIGIQQLEGHVIVPKVMQRAVGLNPLASIIALLIGAKLFGIVGALLAIPVATALEVVLSEVYRARVSKEVDV